MKDSRRSSSTIHQKSVVTHNSLFFPTWFFFHEYSRFTRQQGKGQRLPPYILSITFTRLTSIQTLARLLLQRAHISAQLAPGIEQGTFGTRSLEFTLSTIALVAVAVRRMRKIHICNVQRILLPPNVVAVNIHIFSLVHQLRLLFTLTFAPLPYLFGLCHDMYIQLGRIYLRSV